MASILIAASGLLGGLPSWIELGRRLERAGHRVAVAAPEKVRAVVSAANLKFHPRPEPTLAIFAPCVAPPRPRLRDLTFSGREGRLTDAIEGFDTGVFLNLLDRTQPDILLIDAELHPEIIVAHGRGQRVALLSSMLPAVPGFRSPPLHKLIIPGQGFAGSPIGIALSWLGFWCSTAGSIAGTALVHWGGDYASALRAHARDAGFDLGLMDAKRWQLPWGYKLPTLIPHAEVLDLPAPRPDYLHYIGPMVPKTRAPDPRGATAEAFLRSVSDARATEKMPLIYAGFGNTVAPDAHLIRKLFEVFSVEPDWQLLLVTRMTGPAPASLPPNICWVDWADQNEALKMADLSISHGGINTISESVAHGVPSLVFPVDDLDKHGNAARVVYHRLGAIGRAEDDAAAIRNAIAETMGDEDIRAALAGAKVASARYAAEGVAEDTVEALLDGRYDEAETGWRLGMWGASPDSA